MLLTVLALAGAAPTLGQTTAAADSSVSAWMQEATQHMARDEWGEAAALWSKIIVQDSTHVVAHLNRAMSRYRAGDCPGRGADARQALRLLDSGVVPGDVERLVYRAQAHGHLLEFEQAVGLLEEAESQYPDSRPVSIILRQMRRRATGEFHWTCGSNQP